MYVTHLHSAQVRHRALVLRRRGVAGVEEGLGLEPDLDALGTRVVRVLQQLAKYWVETLS
jgi:hypothetical protein